MSNTTITSENARRLFELLQVCGAVKIDKVIIEPGLVRGVDEDRSVVVFCTDATVIPDLNGFSVGVGRAPQLMKRLSVAVGNDKASFEIVPAQREGEVQAIKFKVGSMKMEYAAAGINVIQAPKTVANDPAWEITLSESEVSQICTVAGMLNTDHAIVTCTNGAVSFEFADKDCQDKASVEIAAPVRYVGAQPEPDLQTFVHYYAFKALITPLSYQRKAGDEQKLIIGTKGTMTLKPLGFDVTLLPRKAGA